MFHAGCLTHTEFFSQEIPARAVNTLPSTRMKSTPLLPLNSSYLLLWAFFVCAQMFWNKALKSVGKVIWGPGNVLDFLSESRQLWAKAALPVAPGSRTCADAEPQARPQLPAAATPLAPAPGTCAGSGDTALRALDDFPGKREGGNCFIGRLAPTRAGVRGQAKQEEMVTGELVGLLVGEAETTPEKWGKGPGQGNEDKVLGQGWGGRLSLARCAEKEGGSGIQSNPKPARSPATIRSLWLLQPLPTSKSLAQCPHPRPLAMVPVGLEHLHLHGAQPRSAGGS